MTQLAQLEIPEPAFCELLCFADQTNHLRPIVLDVRNALSCKGERYARKTMAGTRTVRFYRWE